MECFERVRDRGRLRPDDLNLWILLMAFGIIIKGDSGTIQINDTSPVLSLKTKTTINSISQSTLNSTYLPNSMTGNIFWVIDYTGNNPLVAATCPSGRKLYHLHIYNEYNTMNPPSTGYSRIILWSPGTTAASIDIYLFDTGVDSLVSSGFGLQVRNGSNSLVWRDTQKPLRISDARYLRYTTVGTTVSKVSTKVYAYTISGLRRGFYYPAVLNSKPKSIGVENTSSTVTTIVADDQLDYISLNWTSTLKDDWPLEIFTIDVTNF